MLDIGSVETREAVPHRAKRYVGARLPGVCFCLVVVLASSYISEHYGSSKILGALLLGMAFNSISNYREFALGLDFCARTVLRIGVALLGVRITFSQIADLGVRPLWVVACAVLATLAFSWLVAKQLKLDRASGFISGAAVAICGVSAAMAVATVMQDRIQSEKSTDKHLLCTLVGVTGMSTICMIAYPGLLLTLGLDAQQMGIFLGTSIHDVAQVFGAGQMISPQVAELATYTKMLRVAMLIPVVMVLAFIFRSRHTTERRLTQILPPFLLAFVGFVVLANTGFVSTSSVAVISQISQLCLWLAMAALGAKTNLVELWRVGRSPFLLLLLNTVFIAGLSLLMVI